MEKKGIKVLNLRNSLSPKKIVGSDKLPEFNFSLKPH
jgi:hypothetical protein